MFFEDTCVMDETGDRAFYKRLRCNAPAIAKHTLATAWQRPGITAATFARASTHCPKFCKLSSTFIPLVHRLGCRLMCARCAKIVARRSVWLSCRCQLYCEEAHANFTQHCPALCARADVSEREGQDTLSALTDLSVGPLWVCFTPVWILTPKREVNTQGPSRLSPGGDAEKQYKGLWM